MLGSDSTTAEVWIYPGQFEVNKLWPKYITRVHKRWAGTSLSELDKELQHIRDALASDC